MSVLTYTVLLPLVLMSVQVNDEPTYGLGSPENLLNYELYNDAQYEAMIIEAYLAGYNSIYMITYGEDDPFLDPYSVDLQRWVDRVALANTYGLEVKLFLAEEETMNKPYQWWYDRAYVLFNNLDVEFVISEEFDQPPHALSYDEVRTRCQYLRSLGWQGDIGIHDIGSGIYGFWPFLRDDCLTTFHVQWFRTEDWRDIWLIMNYTTDKEVILSEVPSLTLDNWCQESEAINDFGWGSMFYYPPADLSWNWFTPPIPYCNWRIIDV